MHSICTNCGEVNSGTSTQCQRCKARLTPSTPSVPAPIPSTKNRISGPVVNPSPPPAVNKQTRQASNRVPPSVVPSSPLPPAATTSTQIPAPIPLRTQILSAFRSEMSGEVIWADSSRQEPPDWSFIQAVTRPLVFLGCLVICLLLLLGALVHGHVILILLLGVGLFFFAKLFTTRNLLLFASLKPMLFPSSGRASPLVPVHLFRVRTNLGSEKSVRMKGETAAFEAGHVGVGDHVTFYGQWRGGSLQAWRAYNHNTQAWAAVSRPRGWTLLIIVLIVAVLVLNLRNDLHKASPRSSSSVPAQTQ